MKFQSGIILALASVVTVEGLRVPGVGRFYIKRDDVVYPESTFGDGSATTTDVAALAGIVGALGGSTDETAAATTTAAAAKTTAAAAKTTAAAAKTTAAAVKSSAAETATSAALNQVFSALSAISESGNAETETATTTSGSYKYTGYFATAGASTTKALDSAVATAGATAAAGSGLATTVVDIIHGLPIEGVAGFLNTILEEHPAYLDDVLIWLKDSNLLPKTIIYLLNLNLSSPIIDKVVSYTVEVGTELIYTLNTTDLFVALDRSGLAYLLVSQFITDQELIPAILTIGKGLIASGDITLSEILHAITRLAKREDFDDKELELELPALMKRMAEERANQDLETLFVRDGYMETESDDIKYEIDLDKRDNVEDLLTTIFTSVNESGLLNTTIHNLLTDPVFQEDAVALLSGVFHKFASGSGNPTKLYVLGPIIAGAVESGIIPHIFKQLISDKAVRSALVNDLASLVKKGTTSISSLFKKSDVLLWEGSNYERMFAQAKAQASSEASSATAAVSSVASTLTSVASSASSSASSAISTTAASSSKAGGNIHSSNMLTGFAAVIGYAIML